MWPLNRKSTARIKKCTLIKMEKSAILIVDDEVSITNSLRRRLRDEYRIFTANNSPEALEILKKVEIAVILTDQRMPGVSGVDLLAEAQKIRPQTVGILFSGYVDASALAQAINLGNVRGFLGKPWNMDHIQRVLREAVGWYEKITLSEEIRRASDETIAQLRAEVAELRRVLDTLVFAGSAENHDCAEIDENRQGPQPCSSTASSSDSARSQADA
jgi:YesN/AraC family two-component response regulator